MKIHELSEVTNIPVRQVRYLIAEGLMPAPRGGRAHADYGEDHVAAIQRYTRLRELGFPPAAIKLLQDVEQGCPFPIAPGVTLVIDHKLIASGTSAEPLLDQIRQTLDDILKEQPK